MNSSGGKTHKIKPNAVLRDEGGISRRSVQKGNWFFEKLIAVLAMNERPGVNMPEVYSPTGAHALNEQYKGMVHVEYVKDGADPKDEKIILLRDNLEGTPMTAHLITNAYGSAFNYGRRENGIIRKNGRPGNDLYLGIGTFNVFCKRNNIDPRITFPELPEEVFLRYEAYKSGAPASVTKQGDDNRDNREETLKALTQQVDPKTGELNASAQAKLQALLKQNDPSTNMAMNRVLLDRFITERALAAGFQNSTDYLDDPANFAKVEKDSPELLLRKLRGNEGIEDFAANGIDLNRVKITPSAVVDLLSGYPAALEQFSRSLGRENIIE